MKFEIDIICPDGEFTKEEIKQMIDYWFDCKREGGVAYRVFYDVNEINPQEREGAC